MAAGSSPNRKPVDDTGGTLSVPCHRGVLGRFDPVDYDKSENGPVFGSYEE